MPDENSTGWFERSQDVGSAILYNAAKVHSHFADKSYAVKGAPLFGEKIMSVQAINSQPATLATSGTSPTSTQSSPAVQSASSSKATSSSSPDKVSISSAAHAAFHAALAEATETSVQTAQEASRGDLQAQRLAAKEKAAKGT